MMTLLVSIGLFFLFVIWFVTFFSALVVSTTEKIADQIARLFDKLSGK